MPRLSYIAVVLLATACGSHTPPNTSLSPANPPGAPPPTPPPPPAGKLPEVVRLGPSTQRYVMHQVVHIDQEFQGIKQPLEFGLSAFFRATITGPADTVGYPTTVSVDSIVPDSGTTVPMGINLAAAKGLSFSGRLTAQGDFRNQVPSDSAAAQSLSPIVGSFRNFFPRLPASGLTLGIIWTDTLAMSDRAAGNVTVKSITRSHATTWETRNNARSLRVEVNSTFTIQGSGEQNGQPFQVAGNGVRNGIDYLAVDGRYLGGESSDSTSMTISLPVQAMTIPRTQVSKTTVTVLP